MTKNPDFVLRRLVTRSGTQIRVYDNTVHAGMPTDAGDVEYSYEDALSLLHASGVQSFSTQVRGDCMQDAGIGDGDTVVLEADIEPQNGCIVAASVDGELLLRHFYRSERQKDVVWLVPANNKKGYAPIRVDASSGLRVLGVVVSCVKNFRRREFGIVSRLRSKVDEQRLRALGEPAQCEGGQNFALCVVDSASAGQVVERLHHLIDGRRGKEVAMVVRAAMQGGIITRPTFSQMVAEFGDIGNRAGYHRYMAFDFFADELQPFLTYLQAGASETARPQP